IRATAAFAWLTPRLGKFAAFVASPIRQPVVLVAARDFVVQDQQSTRLKVLVQTTKCRLVIRTWTTAQTEAPAHIDRPVPPREIELMHRLSVQPRRQTVCLRSLTTQRKHVIGDVDAIHFESRLKIGNEQPAGPARDVERRLCRFNEGSEVLDLRARRFELSPPLRDESVVPRRRLGFWLRTRPLARLYLEGFG